MHLDESKYTIKIIDDIKELDLSETIIIADDASYSGSQISNFLDSFQKMRCNIYILIPFISNTAIDVITNGFVENEIDGNLNFVYKNKYIMKS